jgi:predicted ATP-grasp superfamily ATP-dependent carboligase
MEKQSIRFKPNSVIVTAGGPVNGLGVIRAFGRRKIPVIYLDVSNGDATKYSRYITERVEVKSSMESETGYIQTLINLGKQIKSKMLIIPTNDSDVFVLSKYKHELEQYYYLPVAEFEIVNKLVNKKAFYELLSEMNISHPKTYFPESLMDLQETGMKIGYPYIIKPIHSLPFQRKFGRKNFAVNSDKELFRAIEQLKDKSIDVMIQEIIPGNEIYMLYTYFNKESEPLAVCGYDKIRQYPPDFGSGSFCKSNWRSQPIKECINLLKHMKYKGFAEPELKKDPRDGKYKLLEVNARTTTENRLSAACGLDMEYICYLDVTGYLQKTSLLSPQNDVSWVEDFSDLMSCFVKVRRNEMGVNDIIKAFIDQRVHSAAVRDDFAPFVIHFINIGIDTLLSGRSILLR